MPTRGGAWSRVKTPAGGRPSSCRPLSAWPSRGEGPPACPLKLLLYRVSADTTAQRLGGVMVILLAVLVVGGLVWLISSRSGRDAPARQAGADASWVPTRPFEGSTIPEAEIAGGRIVVTGLTKHYQ